MRPRKFLMLLPLMLVALSCTPAEKETSQPTVSLEATTTSPVSNANTGPRVSVPSSEELVGEKKRRVPSFEELVGPAKEEPVSEANTDRQVSAGAQQAAQRPKWKEATLIKEPKWRSEAILVEELEQADKQSNRPTGTLEETKNTTLLLAEKGDKEAQFNLGLMYHRGEGIPQDNKEAIKWLRKAAEQGLAEAQYYLGMMYFIGEDIPQDYKETVKWHTKAAEQGNAPAQQSLGFMYCHGAGIPQDYKEAVKWYTKAAEQGNAEAQYNLGVMYYRGEGIPQDYKEAAKWFTKAAEQGTAEAQYYLGFMYLNGEGVAKDYKEAFKWYTKAAEQGDPSAQYKLGGMYHFGKGVTQDYKEAAKWFTKAAEQGTADAQYFLGVMYRIGQGVAQDYKEAVKWYTKAAEQEDACAQYNLGVMYYEGEGIPQDYKEAVKWFTKAAEQGDADAQFNLGMMFLNGEGVAQNYMEVVKWFTKAAEQGHVGAQHNLGVMYYKGEGVAQDYREAVKWYKKAAEQGDEQAQYKLGVMYSDGKGVLEDYVEAYKWLMLAAASGDENAQFIKQDLRQQLTPSQVDEAQRRAKAFLAKQETVTAVGEGSEIATEQPVVARGTGFLFAKNGLVATNYHVISDGSRINVYFPNAELVFDATIALKDMNSDLAILKIKDFSYDKIFSQDVPFGVKRTSGVQLGEKVFTLGFPLGELLGKSAKFSDGTISSLSGLLGSANLFQINNPIQPGNSGGPLFNQDGDLIGIVLATLDAKFFYENLDTIPQNVNFAIKSDYLINLISMLPEGPSILSHKGSLEDKTQEEQVSSLVPYIVTIRVR